jgi:enoyl-CoA hydratase/carnithine racemase
MTAIDDELLVRIDDGIAHVTLNRPQARNALTFGMYEELAKLCALAGTADDADHIKAIVIAGAGDKAFAAGTDIGQFTAFESTEDGLRYEAKVEAVISQIESCHVPVIAALHGAVTGGGLVIAAAAHVRIASAAAGCWHADCSYIGQLPGRIESSAFDGIIRRVTRCAYDFNR